MVHALVYRSARARDEQGGAVAERAHQVWGEYQRHARRLDEAHSPAGTTPVYDRLVAMGQTRGLVFGQYGEASPDVHEVLGHAATATAQRVWRLMGARSADEARGFVMQQLRRRLGVVAVREMARHRLHRLAYIGTPRGVVDRVWQQRFAPPGALGLGVPARVAAQDFFAHQARVFRVPPVA